MKRVAALLYLSLFSFSGFAQSITLQGIDRGDFERLVSDFSANSQHTSVSGASSLGEIFGFELGIVAGTTSTPELNRLVREQDPGTDVSRLYHGELLGMLSVPAGITLELGLIPKVGTKEFKFNTLGAAVKWTFSDLFFELPVALAVKAQVTKTHVEFASTINSVDTDFKYDNTMTGLMLLVSKDLGLLEPYAAFGTASATGKMVVNGSGTVFNDTSYAASQSASAKRGSTVMTFGTEVKFGVAKLGLEYSRLFSTNRFTGKLSFYF